MDDEQIIDELAGILRHPADRKTEWWRYTVCLLCEVCTWLAPEELDLPEGERVPLFGGSEESGQLLLYDDRKGGDMVVKAQGGDLDADRVLCLVAAKYIRAGIPLPPHLRSYIEKLLDARGIEPHYHEGGDRHANFTRNITIAQAIAYLRYTHSIKKRTIAIPLVRRALEQIGLHISDDGIRQVLKRLPKLQAVQWEIDRMASGHD